MTEAHDKEKVWGEVVASLRVTVSSAVYSTWLSKTHLTSLKKLDKKRYLAEIGCETNMARQTIEQRYFGLIQDALMKTIGAPADLAFVVKTTPNFEGPKEPEAPLFEDRASSDEVLTKVGYANLRLGFTFANFAVSSTNQMAHAAAGAIADAPGTAYNPLFIWGGVGVGKTHIMHAVGHKLIVKNTSTKVLACTGEDFTNDIVEGIRNKTTQNFRNKYRKLNCLLVDDVQFIAGKDTVQEEFFHTFNAVTNSGGQIILTSDQPPDLIPKLEDRLRSRFQAGLIVDISPPDFELRCAIIGIKAREKTLELAGEDIQLIAGNFESARSIAGFLTRLASESKLNSTPITTELIKKLIGKGLREDVILKKATPDEVIEAVCAHFSIGKRAIFRKVPH